MKKSLLICSILLMCAFSSINAREIVQRGGTQFEFDIANEVEPKFVLVDDYNHYLVSAINVHGMLSKHEVIVRKFDQKNQLIDTYKEKFPDIDANTLYRYHGSFEMGTEKVVFFTSCYSGKAQKREVSAIIFDKSSGSFTVKKIASYLIASAMKSGDVDVVASENGKYIAVICGRKGEKKEPDFNDIFLFDALTLNEVWKQGDTVESKYTDRAYGVSNSGKVIILRSANGFKVDNYFVVIDADEQEQKPLEQSLGFQIRVISIGTKDYILALTTGYNSILYDIENGATLNIASIPDFKKLQDVQEVSIREIFIQSNEIQFVAEAKVKAGTRKDNSGMDVAYYKFDPAFLVTINHAGELKSTKKVSNDNTPAESLYHSYGIVNKQGEYIMNSGYIYSVYSLNSGNRVLSEENYGDYNINTDGDEFKDIHYVVKQLFLYSPNSNKLTFVRTHGKKQMSLVSLENIF
ncbi:hypothetical protein LJB95_02030 [Paludibacteraceae bacterium OttesenSCG-928-F17]|nr:hypothetical protein [Paludibacteraceae bacterium OttesenSCG-928-F17]